jgi:peptide/nickel transport system substrate-binding protein
MPAVGLPVTMASDMHKLAPKTRRDFLIGSGATVISGVLLAGCSEPRQTAAPRATVSAPRRGGTLRYGTIGDYTSLEPGIISTQLADNVWSVWDRLTVYDEHHMPQPLLAERWEVSEDRTHFAFHLRRGVQFHTGRELTADDVKWSLRRLLDPKVGSPLTGRLEPLADIETPDKYTVIVTASRPWVEAFDLFEQANIIDPVSFELYGVSKPTGTGSFVFKEYAQGNFLRLVRNTQYWDSARPYLDEVVVSIHADPQTAVVQLESGALDVVGWGLPVADAVRFQTDPGYRVLVNPSSGSSWDWLANCTVAPTDNKLVRQALNYALDRKRMANVIWRGLAKAQALPWSPTSPAYDATRDEALTFDLDRARSLLAASGFTSLQLDLSWTTSTPDFMNVAEIYQADLAKIGISATLKPLEPAAALATRNSRSWRGLLFSQNTLGHMHPLPKSLVAPMGRQRSSPASKPRRTTPWLPESRPKSIRLDSAPCTTS